MRLGNDRGVDMDEPFCGTKTPFQQLVQMSTKIQAGYIQILMIARV